MNKVIIIGAGIIGMLTARLLTKTGVSVTIIEQGYAGKESSWAGGGIISPL
ncbi:MAG TPA: FAD-dependent oxidoreductase, partial [Aeromonadales bacterium]|nr:FAD-dependent oxidoreductase [Aeromonadales bacterium]